ncbi:hypothetical protein CDIK_0460 [Cucumispora dikerogammari]|nr:hypothetical protein CDIK_0460 [Cucumispora dikerogammari]
MKIILNNLETYVSLFFVILVLLFNNKLPTVLVALIFISTNLYYMFILYFSYKNIFKEHNLTPLIVDQTYSLFFKKEVETTYHEIDSNEIRWVFWFFITSFFTVLVFSCLLNTDALYLYVSLKNIYLFFFEPVFLIHWWRVDVIRPFDKIEVTINKLYF